MDYENDIIELFKNMGYHYVYGSDIENREPTSPLYEEILLDSLCKINKTLPLSAIQEAINKLKDIENGSLEQQNSIFTDYLQNGIAVHYIENNEKYDKIVYLIDYSKPNNNSFIITNQLRIVGKSPKRLDVLLFINGLPLVLMELKSPSRENTDVSEAYRQIQNYKKEISSVFIYNAICVMSDGIISKAGTITSSEDRFMAWKSTDGSYENTKYAQYDTFFKGMFQKERLLDIIKKLYLFLISQWRA